MKKIALLFYLAYTVLTIYIFYRWFGGSPPERSMTAITTLLGFGFALSHAVSQYGWKKSIIFILTCVLVSLAFESIGVATGKVYGPYHYTDKLGPKFLGLVPYLIPFTWVMVMYPSMLMAQKLIHASQPRGWKLPAVSAIAALILTSWDLVMDPVMVQGGHWVWDGPGRTLVYFGIPIQNFIGWWITGLVVFLVFYFITANYRVGSGKAEVRLPILMYATVGVSSILAAYLTGVHGPALVGFMAMIPWVLAVLF